MRRLRVGLLDSHPIQYNAPWFRALAEQCDLHVFFAHHQSADQQAAAGYGVAFEWDVDLLAGYQHTLLTNVARDPNVFSFSGCDTPEIADHIASNALDAMIVSGWYLKTYWQAALACARHDVPLLVRGDSRLGGPRPISKRMAKRFVYPPLLGVFDGFLSVGQRNREYLEHYGVPAERIHFVPRFVDNDFFRERSSLDAHERAAVRARFGATPSDRVVLFVGRFLDWKRPLDLLQAAAASQRCANTVVVFAGAGPLEPEIRSTGARLGVRMALLGFQNQSHLPAVYGASDVLVLPSSAEETWGLVANEAMACGLPVIASDAVGCAPDLIDPGNTGWTYPMGCIAALAAALDRIEDLRGRSSMARDLRAKMEVFGCSHAVHLTLKALAAVVR
jgi:glycosyltransferase involved in cell wall biosynthesis